MRESGMTQARSMGPVAAAVQRAGGSVSRLFRRAELPLRLIEHPDCLIPLRDQLKLVEYASREIADAALPARLSTEGGVEHLGAFGQYVCGAPRLGEAITRCNAYMSSMLQSGTRLSLVRVGRDVRWSYWLTDGAEIGRQKNEILALGYMLDLLRRYAGHSPTVRGELPGPPVAALSSIQDQFGCELVRSEIAALVFPAQYLEYPQRARVAPAGLRQAPQAPRAARVARVAPGNLPDPCDLVAQIECLVALGLLERRPTQAWVCRRLRIPGRSMQRSLARAATSFQQIRERVLSAQATQLLRCGDLSITQIALDLGYSDPAHFTRAFIQWFGESPRTWRSQAKRSTNVRVT